MRSDLHPSNDLAIGGFSLRPALGAVALSALLLGACQPSVKIEPPDKPIVIDLNVNIKQDVRVKVDRELEGLLEDNPDLF